ncbi:MAG: hypothetical protein M1812_000520 [Candelaria pacifica]|nr:MAG: hypothetical protein M1812_000520 [Candelaria pacifica]
MRFSTFPLLSILSLFLHNGISNAIDFPSSTEIIASVKQTLALWSIVVDSKNYPVLSQIFTSDVFADVAANEQNPRNLAQLTTFYEASFAGAITLHEDSTQYIEVLSPTNAKATHYDEAVYFGQGNLTGQVLTFYESYVDFLRPEEGVWKIYNRTLTIVTGNPIGNRAVQPPVQTASPTMT